MVKLADIKASNARLDAASAPRVAVFVGGTSGVGKLTLAGLVALGTPLKAYVVGRPETEASFRPVLDEIRATNAQADIVWLEGQASLLADVKRICELIRQRESSLDLLFLTAGYAPFSGRHNTPEGLDVTHALEYYSRIAFALHLLPLLRASGRGRVVSVLAGGLEMRGTFSADDPNLDKAGAFGMLKTQFHMGIMNSLGLERLAEADENHPVVFIHAHPGAVNTGNAWRGWNEGSWAARVVVGGLIEPIFGLVGFSFDESAARNVYLATSDVFGRGAEPAALTTRGKKSGGLFLANKTCDSVTNEKNITDLRASAGDKVWEKTMEILRDYL